ncbi:hypothetical protein EXIGLDRAFT_760427 [Exidia glandulosa HHB12029]|uniref:Protein kinase domain-containing protein n=1 Tax=Exidia glandulosa HHB12029 TaxID=1314781 RepID=A0A166BK30_EXIGL|nr:hypothetical protein EXIGLDRAFT_760427 [Exidia glandulosa HHB12029]
MSLHLGLTQDLQENILITDAGDAVLSDVALASAISVLPNDVTSDGITAHDAAYLPQEVFESSTYDAAAVDVYAFGTVLYQGSQTLPQQSNGEDEGHNDQTVLSVLTSLLGKWSRLFFFRSTSSAGPPMSVL